MNDNPHPTGKLMLLTALIGILLAFSLSGCIGSENTIQHCIIADTAYTTKDILKTATQPDTLKSNETVYASVHVIESPKGMSYTAKWYLDGTELKSEAKETANDMQDVLVYQLEADSVTKGTLTVEIIYQNTVLYTKKLSIV